MTIIRDESETKGRLVCVENELEMGEMTYSLANNGSLMIVDHTGVGKENGGKGIGKLLFCELVEVARTLDRNVMPLCPFVKSMFEKSKETWDVLRHNSL